VAPVSHSRSGLFREKLGWQTLVGTSLQEELILAPTERSPLSVCYPPRRE
jgi:hypothetical protein